MAANVHVVLSWICDGSLPEKPGKYLVEYKDGRHSTLIWSPTFNWATIEDSPEITAWARIPSVKGF